MGIEAIAPVEARRRIAATLQIDAADDVALIAQALRRTISNEAPVARHRVERILREALTPIGPQENWETAIAECLDDLIQYGDVFEIRVEDIDTGRGAYQLRPAPPAFVRREDGSYVLLGVAGDEITPLAADWGGKLSFRRGLRYLSAGVESEAMLKGIGVPELGARVWLRAPAKRSAADFLSDWSQRLEPCTSLEGVELLGSGGRGRWAAPAKQDTGAFVGRRPQLYGSPRWCLVRLQTGTPVAFVDIAADGDVERPCDIGWRLRAAIDATQGKPHRSEWRLDREVMRAAFYQPLPSWAERRLEVVGEKSIGQGCLFSFAIRQESVATEAAFLREMLWMQTEGAP